MKFSKDKRLISVAALLMGGIFISDIFTPLGIADGISYIAVVLLTLWMRKGSYTLNAALTATVLTCAGVAFSPKGEILTIFLTNRILSLFAIWVTAYAILKYKKSERISSKNRDSLNALFNYASEGIIVTNNNGEMIMINPEAEKMFEYSEGELLGQKIEWILSGKISEFLNSENKDVRTILKEIELTGRKKSGAECSFEVRLSSYLLDTETYYIVFIHDITERKKHQLELKQSHEELKQYAHHLKETNAELENFAYISSHDLQEPLRKIQSFGDRLKVGESGQLSETGREYVDRMLNAAGRMQRLIDDLLSFSRLTSKARKFEMTNLNQVLEEVLSDMEISIEDYHADIMILNALPVIEADPTQMRQLFQNLISNSIKFRKETENPVIKIYSAIIDNDMPNDTRNGYNVKIIIEDNGIGFDEKYLGKIFGIFQRLNVSKYEGSGIGLAICKKITQRHGGDITAKSVIGKGSKFIITLPIKQDKSGSVNKTAHLINNITNIQHEPA